jgi:phospholipase/carboxylesterase
MNDLEFVHQFLPAPSGAKPARTLLLLHGTGGDENQLVDLGQAIDPEAALLSPRGKILEKGAPRFFRRLAEGVFDEADVVTRANQLASFVAAAAKRYEIDLSRLVAVGYSNGANIAAAMMLLGVAPFNEAILLRPMVPLSQIKLPDLKNARVLLSAGQFDPIARLQIVKRLGELFREAGAAILLVVQPSGHELTGADVETAQRWIALSERDVKREGRPLPAEP